MPGTHFAVILSEEEIAALADSAVQDLAERLAHRAFRPLSLDSGNPDEAAEIDALARLHALVHIRRAVARQEDAAARHAATAGAGYPELGQVSNISRQGARRRWPGLVAAGRPSQRSASDAAEGPADADTGTETTVTVIATAPAVPHAPASDSRS